MVSDLSHELLPLMRSDDDALFVKTENFDVFIAKLVVGDMSNVGVSFVDSVFEEKDVVFPNSVQFMGNEDDEIGVLVS